MGRKWTEIKKESHEKTEKGGFRGLLTESTSVHQSTLYCYNDNQLTLRVEHN